MTSSHGRTPADVRAWPADLKTSQALRDYLDALPRDSGDVLEVFDGEGLNFAGADLSGLDLIEAEFSDTALQGIPFAGAALSGAWFNGATLSGANLSGCLLLKVQARNCDMQNAVLRGANLDRADLDGTDLRNADLTGTAFGRASLRSADLRGANLSNCEFGPAHSTDLPNARIAGVLVTGATGRVSGPVDIGTDDTPHLIDGDELQTWFASQGAQVEVTPPTAS